MAGQPTPADPTDIKMAAHDLRLGAVQRVHAVLRDEMQRLREFEDAHRGASGTALTPVRGALVIFRQLDRLVEPLVRQVAREARNFERANYDVDDGELGGR